MIIIIVRDKFMAQDKACLPLIDLIIKTGLNN